MLSIGVKVMGVPGPKLLEDERFTQDFTGIPGLPGRPSDNYLRDAMARTLTEQPARFEMLLQLQSDARSMAIEYASVRWAAPDWPPVVVATLELPSQRFDTEAQLAFASRLSINPWHCLPAHHPLGNQNHGRPRIYQTLSLLRQHMNNKPHVEPDGIETFDPPLAS